MMKKIFKTKEKLILFIIIIISGVALISWATGKLLFAQISLSYIPIAPSTALFFLMISISLLLLINSRTKQYLKFLSIALSSLIIIASSIILIKLIFDFNWDIEDVFIKNPIKFKAVLIGRMSPLTAILFILNCFSVILFSQYQNNKRLIQVIYSIIVSLSFFISSILLIGYLYNAPLLYGGNIIPVALPTAACFWLFSAVLIILVDFKFIFFSTETQLEKMLSKTLIPLVLSIIIVNGFINSRIYLHTNNQAIFSAFLLIFTLPITAFLIKKISRKIGKSIEEAQKEVKDSEKKYNDLFKNMNEGFALHETISDKSGKIIDYKYLDANPSFGKMINIIPGQVIGKTVREIFSGIENDPANWIGKFGEVAITGKKITFEDFSERLGSWFLINAFSPTKGQFATTFMDITERKQAEEKLKEYQNQLEILVKERTLELEEINNGLIEKNTALEKYHDLFINREFRIKELKEKIEELEKDK